MAARLLSTEIARKQRPYITSYDIQAEIANLDEVRVAIRQDLVYLRRLETLWSLKEVLLWIMLLKAPMKPAPERSSHD